MRRFSESQWAQSQRAAVDLILEILLKVILVREFFCSREESRTVLLGSLNKAHKLFSSLPFEPGRMEAEQVCTKL